MTGFPPPAAPPYRGSDRRDPRVDMLRGLSLMMVFINHIPFNSLTCLTIRPFGFSDAAELFVFLAGYSAWMCYPGVIDREGWAAGLGRIGRRCVTIWGAHALLLCGTLLLVLIRFRLTGRLSVEVEPLIGDGIAGLARGLTLMALPSYLDILPLYILLLAAFPLLVIGFSRSMAGTLVVSVAIYAAAASQDWNLPNVIDPRSAARVWTFNPLTWQLVFVLGAAMAEGRRRGWAWLSEARPGLRACCFAVLAYAFLAMNPAHLWPALAEHLIPAWALDDEWKVREAPWRLVNALALLYLLLTAEGFKLFGRLMQGRAMLACGRHSLAVFSAGCIFALIGRFAYADIGISPALQLAVNGLGLGGQIALAFRLEQRRAARNLAGTESWAGRERRA